ncbi:PrgI family protein [Micromonospora sp. DR5-3]|uniref:PrgI family protein n=1 Tax=unclassified Micromonospora TaxID=2617518 RepID=UPI0011D8A5B4|nr:MULTISPECIES: PrgI family protein [unclassified Micromonospora]MCW3818603.1 PrgI family protein [Micromonospora sp. DR5-3]TYC20058.1 PrgI family protein [Micromonospora sp. MP36]
MNPKKNSYDEPYRARVPADVDAPDKVLYGLTFRQLAILAVAALALYGAWRALHDLVPVPVLVGTAVLFAGLAFGVAVGRRDGLPLDVWLLAAVRHARAPRALSTTDTTSKTPDWVQAPASAVTLPAPLKLPADAIDDGGEIRLGGARAAMVAATSVNLALRTPEEQAALVDTFGRWLNSLSTPTQIVVSAQPVDLHSAARTLAQTAEALPHPALADAAADHARFLDDLATRRDPLRRQVLIVTSTSAGERGERAARRRAENTVRALSGLGVTTRALDGAAVTAALASAADPYRPPRPGGLAAPDTVITSPTPDQRHRTERSRQT